MAGAASDVPEITAIEVRRGNTGARFEVVARSDRASLGLFAKVEEAELFAKGYELGHFRAGGRDGGGS